MSRETLDADGGGVTPLSTQPADRAIDLDLPAEPGAAPAADSPPDRAAAPADTRTTGRAAGRTAGRTVGRTAGPAGAPDADPDAARDPDSAADRTTDPAGGPDVEFAADLDDETAPPAPAPVLGLLSARWTRALVAIGAALALVVVAAIGGYTQAQKAQTREALGSARLVLQLNQDFLNIPRNPDGSLPDPIPVNVELSVTSSVTLTVSRLVLPAGTAIPRSRFVVRPGTGGSGEFLITSACPPGFEDLPVSTRASALVRTSDGKLRTLPVALGALGQLLSRDYLCATNRLSPQAQPVVVTSMFGRRGGLVVIQLRSRSDRDLRVTAQPAAAGSEGWQVGQVPAKPLTLPAGGSAELTVRLQFPVCIADGTIPATSNLVDLQWSAAGAADQTTLVQGIEVDGWDDSAVTVAAADAAVRACGTKS